MATNVMSSSKTEEGVVLVLEDQGMAVMVVMPAAKRRTAEVVNFILMDWDVDDDACFLLLLFDVVMLFEY